MVRVDPHDRYEQDVGNCEEKNQQTSTKTIWIDIL